MSDAPSKDWSDEPSSRLLEALATLARVGFPLGAGLRAMARELPDVEARRLRHVADRLDSGQSLLEALPDDLPAPHRAAVAAGLRLGRLPEALDALVGHARLVRNLRLSIEAALVYPLVVAVLSYALVVFSAAFVAPRVADALVGLVEPSSSVPAILRAVAESTPRWAPVPPVLLALALLAWFAYWRHGLLSRGPLARLPVFRRIRADADSARLAALAALLLDARLPHDQALELAASAIRNPRARDDLRRHAQRLAEGDRSPRELPRSLAPALRWALAAPEQLPDPAATLRALADTYSARVVHSVNRLRAALPAILLVLVAGTIVLVQGVLVFLPVSRALAAID